MNGRSLCASINQTEIGTLQEVAGLWRFQYAADWLGNPRGFALSPHLPLTAEFLLDGASKRPVQWYFDNRLPEEDQRVLLAGDAKLEAADAFGLLAWYGAESAVSVTLLPPDAAPQMAEPLRPLSSDVHPSCAALYITVGAWLWLNALSNVSASSARCTGMNRWSWWKAATALQGMPALASAALTMAKKPMASSDECTVSVMSLASNM